MVAAGSWLSRIRSVNIVQQRSNKLKQKQKDTSKKPLAQHCVSVGPESRTCCAQSHGTIVPRARFRSPGSNPRPDSGRESARGQTPRPEPGRRPSGHLPPGATLCLELQSGRICGVAAPRNPSPARASAGQRTCSSGRMFPQLPGRSRVVGQCLRPPDPPSPRPPKSRPRSLQDGVAPALGPRKRLGSAKECPDRHRGARDGTSCLDPGRPRS